MIDTNFSWRHKSPKISQKYMTSLSLLLLFFAIAGLGILPEAPLPADVPTLTVPRNDKGQIFILDRTKRAPIHYIWLHVVPSMVWCIIYPLQHVRRIRVQRPKVHRILGYTAATLSLILTISGLALPLRRLSYSHPNFFHLHTLRIGGPKTRPLLAWPTFDAALPIIGILLPWTLFHTIKHARAKQFVEHQRWATLHTLVGYIVPLQRAYIVAFQLGGHILFHLPQHLKDKIAVPVKGPEAWAAEQASFALTTWFALGHILIRIALAPSTSNQKSSGAK